MVDWALENVPPSSNPAVLEVGSGNGTLLLSLLEAGYDGSTLYGIDYSEGAIALAQAVAKSRGGSNITFSQCDFLVDEPLVHESTEQRPVVWDLIMDKGTYDAVALGTKNTDSHSPAIHYPGRVARLLTPGGIFLVTCWLTASQTCQGLLTAIC